MNCKHCGRSFERPSKRGRPSVYCTERCRDEARDLQLRHAMQAFHERNPGYHARWRATRGAYRAERAKAWRDTSVPRQLRVENA